MIQEAEKQEIGNKNILQTIFIFILNFLNVFFLDKREVTNQ